MSSCIGFGVFLFIERKQMEFDGKFLQYQSNNILYMDLPLTLSQAKNKCLKDQHNHIQGEQIIKKREIQNQDRKSCAASINQNIENANKQEGNQGQNEVKASDNMKNHTMLKMAFTGATLLQFSILFGLILIQYISSKIELSTLVTLITIDVAIHVLLIGLAHTIASEEHLKKQLVMQREQEDKQGKEIEQLPTLPKINQQMCKRSNAKTKKIPFANNRNTEEQKNTEQTIKKETFQDQKENVKKEKEENDENSFESYRKCIIILKIMQAVLVVVMSTLSLFVLKVQNGKERQAIVVLSIITYLLATCSMGIFWQLYNKILCHYRIKTQRRVQRQQHNQAEPQHNPKTVISIEQAIEVKASDSNKILHVENKEKLQSHIGSINENSGREKRQEESEKEQELCKIEIKKSVLKTKKKAKIEQHQDMEENIQRRKVGINSKKIEYFQYSVISPSHSVVDDQQIKNNTSVKSKYGLQKMAHIKQKMDKEEMILKNKLMARQAKSKSLGRIGREPMKKEEQKIEDSFMADYFF